ncbi:MAG: DUF5753 domain-containing protein [Patescibacteria group bacterium]
MNKSPGSSDENWWEPYTTRGLYPGFADFLAIETRATAVDLFGAFIPGLLQTEQYAKELFKQFKAITPDAPSGIKLRLARQWHAFERPEPLRVHAVIDEVTLLRVMGNAQVQYEQLIHLRRLSDLPHITIQILPIGGGVVPPLLVAQLAIYIFHFSDTPYPTISVEAIWDTRHSTNTTEVGAYQKTFVELRVQALDTEKSALMIEDIARKILNHYPETNDRRTEDSGE